MNKNLTVSFPILARSSNYVYWLLGHIIKGAVKFNTEFNSKYGRQYYICDGFEQTLYPARLLPAIAGEGFTPYKTMNNNRAAGTLRLAIAMNNAVIKH